MAFSFRFLTSCIVLLFLVYNSVAAEVFAALRCYERKVPVGVNLAGGTKLLRADMEVGCMVGSIDRRE